MKDAAAQPLGGKIPKETFHHVEPRGAGGCEMQVEARVPGLAVRRRKEVLRQRLFWVRERTKIRNRTHALLDRQNTETK